MIIYPIKYQDSVDLEGDGDSLITLLTVPEQRMLQSILNNVESNPDVYIEDYFEQDTDEVDAFLSALMLKLMGSPVPTTSPDRQRLNADGVNNIGGTFAFQVDATSNHNGFWSLTSAITSWVEWESISLKKGTYKAVIFGFRNSNQGIVSLKIGSSTVETTLDMYNAATLRNAKVTSGNFVIDADTTTFVRAAMDSKNASSGGYQLAFNWIDIYRISD